MNGAIYIALSLLLLATLTVLGSIVGGVARTSRRGR